MTRTLPIIARILLGVLLLFFGLFGFLTSLHVKPQPAAQLPPRALEFSNALRDTGYMMVLVSGTQVVVGALLLSNCYVPLALTLLAPLIVNILAFHLFLELSGIIPGLVVALLEVYLVWVYRESYRAVLTFKAAPGSE